MEIRSVLKKIKPLFVKIHVFNFLLCIYIWVTDFKKRVCNSINKNITKTIPVLLYHRIDDLTYDPVMLAVQPETFEKHLQYISKNYESISLSQLVNRINNKSLTGREICITFDDGYQDNLTKALPILEKYNIPATIFITTSQIGEKASFPWDMKYKESEKAMFLSETEIRKLANHPLIEIGAHTHTHIRLSDFSEEIQRLEIEKSKNILEKIIDKKIIHFAYTFGSKEDFTKKTQLIVKNLGFISAYENTGILGTYSSNLFSFPRINIRECSVEQLIKSIN